MSFEVTDLFRFWFCSRASFGNLCFHRVFKFINIPLYIELSHNLIFSFKALLFVAFKFCFISSFSYHLLENYYFIVFSPQFCLLFFLNLTFAVFQFTVNYGFIFRNLLLVYFVCLHLTF